MYKDADLISETYESIGL